MSNNTVKWTPLDTAALISNTTATASAGFATPATIYDNSLATARHQFGFLQLQLASLAVANPGVVTFYATPSLDGTNYADSPSATNPAGQDIVAICSVATTTAAHDVNTPMFPLAPIKYKFAFQNQLGVALSNSTNTFQFYTANHIVL